MAHGAEAHVGAHRMSALLCSAMPLAVRKRIAVWLNRQRWIPRHQWRAAGLVRDLARSDPDGYHRFLWSNHLGYAESYEPRQRFGPANIRPERHLLFDDLRAFLLGRGLRPESDIRSVLEVGCSLGHLLHYMEANLFPGATRLEGFDIDRYAIDKGNAWLRERRSRVRLTAADMALLDQALEQGRTYDVVLCAGVLMYLREEPATEVLASMLRRADRVLVLSGLSHPREDNARLAHSEPRRADGAFRHNFDAMVERVGGRVVFRRWSPSAPRGWNPPYFVFCERS